MYRSRGEKLFEVVNVIVMLLVCAMVLLPFMNLLATSLSDSVNVVGGRVKFIPLGFNLQSYAKILQSPATLRGFANSVLYTGTAIVIAMFLTVTCAYPLSKTKLRGRGIFMGGVIFTMFFARTLIPTYMLVKNLRLIDTMWALVLPFAITPYYLLLVISFFRSIPPGIEESAALDGLNPIQTLFRIVLPTSRPILATIFMFVMVDNWNNWFNPMIYLNSQRMQPLMLIIRNIITGSNIAGMTFTDVSMSSASLSAAAMIIATVPIMLVFPFSQRFFIKGVMIGAVKG